ncbi:GDNF family receptor alpha-like [Erpetoichthys calabaricus]|uniref:GDNF family receptor alpha-like n=1 Tax=Erpetoichthys calabaricus TaxID=27687 RepID=UPI0022347C21|nr:GDNF family receptor alpha-like [Erpetoichthys calabaricus]
MAGKGPSLRIVDSSDCNITIQYLTDRYLEFRSCVNTKTSLCHLLLDESCVVKADRVLIILLCLRLLSGPVSVRSCTEIKKLCIQNETCNRLLVPRLSACPEDPAQCNASRCQMAVQHFYEKLPFNMAEMLAFCDCSAVDDDCLHLKRSFHDRMCSGDITPSSTCINVLDRCMADAACRHRFDAFHSKCWSEGQEVCNGSKDCRAAFIATRGTVLQIPCTCKGLERSHWSKCKHFQSLFHGKSCFGTLNFIMECTRL